MIKNRISDEYKMLLEHDLSMIENMFAPKEAAGQTGEIILTEGENIWGAYGYSVRK